MLGNKLTLKQKQRIKTELRSTEQGVPTILGVGVFGDLTRGKGMFGDLTWGEGGCLVI